MIAFEDPAVREVFDGYPNPIQYRMLALRDLVFTGQG